MAFLSIHHLPGDPDELLERKRRNMDPVIRQVAPGYGALWSATAIVADGLVTVNLWESASGAAEFSARDEVRVAQQASGLPMPDRFERYDNVSIDKYTAVRK